MIVLNIVFLVSSAITFILVLASLPRQFEGTYYFILIELPKFIYMILMNSLEHRNMLIRALDCVRPGLLFC